MIVAVCGTSVPDVGDELEVVECAVVEVVARAFDRETQLTNS